ncbi:MAG: Gfo/Idh/MocA family oxidoreductase [Thomasclavelia sp.]|nr:Gfo/Idh/MocA family oxidoreductase [Thomasclavelia sp.]
MLVVAYIGFGNSCCRYHLPYVQKRKDTVKVKYIYRLPEEIDPEKESWYPGIIFTSNINDIMDDSEVNLVSINCPDEFHEKYSIQAIERNKNVLCEKPFALTSEGAKKIFDYAKEKGVVIMPNQNRRFDADMRTIRKVIKSGVLGEILEVESHYDYYRPQIANHVGMGMLYGLGVHPIDQMIGEFGLPNKVVYDCRSFDNPGKSDDYYDIDLFYGNMKAIVKTSFYVKIDYPRFIIHGRKGSFIMPQLGHQSSQGKTSGPVQISFNPLPEDKWGILSYFDDNGQDITKKVPTEIQDYGIIYDILYDVIFNHGTKVIKDEEVIEVLKIIEEATKVAREAKQ